ncbi:MAG: hypothetical protein ACTSWN_10205 [Promethearchaeota archaeon]
MPGIYHVLFGVSVGLLLWYLTRDVSGKKKWDIFIIFAFAFNNYIGPDMGNIIKKISRSLESEYFHEIGLCVHSYLGWIFWAPVMSFLMYYLYRLMILFKLRILTKQNLDHRHENNILVYHTYTDIFFATIAGGIGHLFIDTIGHAEDGGEYVYGKMPFYSPYYIEYFIFISIIYIVIFGVLYRDNKRNEFKQLIFKPKSVFWVIGTMGFLLVNFLVLYYIAASNNALLLDEKNYSWMTKPQKAYFFMLGRFIFIFRKIPGDASWWYAIALIPFLVVFVYGYITEKSINFLGRKCGLKLLAFLLFIILLLIGYAIQPFIGKVAGKEFDVGICIYLWATLLSMLLILNFIDINQMTKQESDGLQMK